MPSIRFRYSLWVLGALLAATLAASSFDAPHLDLIGNAKPLGDGIRLTPAAKHSVGAAWCPQKERVGDGFEATFRFQITEPGGLGNGADGFAFVLQNSGASAIAGRGSAGGFALGDGYGNPHLPGIPRSLAVFFDTFRNREVKDPSGNYIGICTNGSLGEMHWPPSRLGFTHKLPFRLKDGRVHSVRIQYDPPLMTVSLDDGDPVLRVPVDLSTVVDANGAAFYGFTASTGEGCENHDVFGWSLTPSQPRIVVQSSIHFLNNIACMEGRNLCTPKQAIVEERGPGKYHIILPAHLAWGASIPNSFAGPLTLSNLQGNVCWALNAGVPEECSGPEGLAPKSPGANKMQGECLDPNRKQGALIQKNDGGRTWFSVNDRKHGGFENSQGFFEFDVSTQ